MTKKEMKQHAKRLEELTIAIDEIIPFYAMRKWLETRLWSKRTSEANKKKYKDQLYYLDQAYTRLDKAYDAARSLTAIIK